MAVTSIDLLNKIREDASSTYKERIPLATQNNLADIANILLDMAYDDSLNEWMGAIGKIALTIFTNRAYSNPLKSFKKGKLPLGSTIEEIFVGIAKGEEFDPEGTDALKRTMPDAVTLYHYKEFFHTYKASISRAQVINAFQSVSALDRFFVEVVNALYSGYEQDEFLTMRNLITSEIPNSYKIAIPFETGNGKLNWHNFGLKLVTEIRRMAMNLSGYLSTKYNPLKVATTTPRDRLALFVDSNVLANVGTSVFASAFNVGEVQWDVRIIPLPTLAYLDEQEGSITIGNDSGKPTPIAVMVDTDSLLIFDKQVFMDRQHNGKGAFDNFFLHVNELMGFSHVGNIISFSAVSIDDAQNDFNRLPMYGIGQLEAPTGFSLFADENGAMTSTSRIIEPVKSGNNNSTYTFTIPVIITTDARKHDLSGLTGVEVNVIQNANELRDPLSPENTPTKWDSSSLTASFNTTSKSRDKVVGSITLTGSPASGSSEGLPLLGLRITSLTGAK